MSWMTFVSDCKLVSRRCPAGEFELVWSIVNAMDEGTKEVDVDVHMPMPMPMPMPMLMLMPMLTRLLGLLVMRVLLLLLTAHWQL